MLFLSQVLGEEEDADRREQLFYVLTRAVRFTGEAQTPAGGWGYVDRQGRRRDLMKGPPRLPRFRGSAVAATPEFPCPRRVIDKAIGYIHKCTLPDEAYNTTRKAAAAGRRLALRPSPASIMRASTTANSCPR